MRGRKLNLNAGSCAVTGVHSDALRHGKLYAFINGITIGQLVSEAITEYLAKRKFDAAKILGGK